jgi:hypothetical protein
VRGRTAGTEADLGAEEVQLATRILEVVAEDFAVESDDGQISFRLQKSAVADGG